MDYLIPRVKLMLGEAPTVDMSKEQDTQESSTEISSPLSDAVLPSRSIKQLSITPELARDYNAAKNSQEKEAVMKKHFTLTKEIDTQNLEVGAHYFYRSPNNKGERNTKLDKVSIEILKSLRIFKVESAQDGAYRVISLHSKKPIKIPLSVMKKLNTSKELSRIDQK